MKVLCLTGGGLFTYWQAKILSYFSPEDFDVFGGTSGGAINAVGFQVKGGKSLLNFWEEKSRDIFSGYSFRRFKPWCPRYSDKALNAALTDMSTQECFGTLRNTFVGCHDVNRGQPKVFSSLDPEDAEWPMWQVVRASSGAQTFFDPWKGLSDGGLFFNDPVSMTVCAVKASGLVEDFSSLKVVGIGSGMDDENHNRGRPVLHPTWLRIILHDLLEGGSVKKERFYAKEILGCENYLHVDFVRHPSLSFDNPQVIDWVSETQEESIFQSVEKIAEFLSH